MGAARIQGIRPPAAGAGNADVTTTAPDATPDALSAGDAATAARVTFTVRNETSGPIYLQVGAFWTLYRGGQILYPEDTGETATARRRAARSVAAPWTRPSPSWPPRLTPGSGGATTGRY
jgi:hypothetical protein